MALNFANNNSLSAITSLPASISGGGMTLIQEQTASSSSTISFTSGIDSTYDEYVFKFYDIHPSNTSGPFFTFQGNVSGGSGYNETITSTCFTTYQMEDDSQAGLTYIASGDQAQGTGFNRLGQNVGAENNECIAGTLHLFNPSSTTFVKHFIARGIAHANDDGVTDAFNAGYFNTTSAIDEIQFKMSSGNIDAGDICLYGIA